MDDSLFSVKYSTIPKAGKGLFTNIDIVKGTVVLQYDGKHQSYHSHKNHDYCYGLRDGLCINALKSQVLARYVNDNYNHSGRQINLEWVVEGDEVFMVSIGDIRKGSELLISYGWKYWL